jgi:hypothetical protein
MEYFNNPDGHRPRGRRRRGRATGRRLRSVKLGGSRRISARALHEYVVSLEVGEPA